LFTSFFVVKLTHKLIDNLTKKKLKKIKKKLYFERLTKMMMTKMEKMMLKIAGSQETTSSSENKVLTLSENDVYLNELISHPSLDKIIEASKNLDANELPMFMFTTYMLKLVSFYNYCMNIKNCIKTQFFYLATFATLLMVPIYFLSSLVLTNNINYIPKTDEQLHMEQLEYLKRIENKSHHKTSNTTKTLNKQKQKAKIIPITFNMNNKTNDLNIGKQQQFIHSFVHSFIIIFVIISFIISITRLTQLYFNF
jgi:hypothetical protein